MLLNKFSIFSKRSQPKLWLTTRHVLVKFVKRNMPKCKRERGAQTRPDKHAAMRGSNKYFSSFREHFCEVLNEMKCSDLIDNKLWHVDV